MEKIKNYLGDAILLACITVFSYYVFLSYERGYLSAFGINSAGLVPLQVQSIIPVIISTLLLSGAIIMIAIVTVRVARWLLKRVPEKKRTIAEVAILMILFSMFVLPIAGFFWSTNKLVFVMLFLGPIGELIIISTFIPRKDVSRINTTILKSFNLSVDNARIILTIIGLAVVVLPTYAFCFGFTNARSGTTFEEIMYGSKHYIVVRQYNDRVILVQISGNEVLPGYKVSYLSGSETIDFQDIEVQHLDFNKVRSYTSSLDPYLFSL